MLSDLVIEVSTDSPATGGGRDGPDRYRGTKEPEGDQVVSAVPHQKSVNLTSRQNMGHLIIWAGAVRPKTAKNIKSKV